MNYNSAAKEMKLMDSKTRSMAKRAARMYDMSPESLIWAIVAVYSDGTMRSNAWADVPDHVLRDGLVERNHRPLMEYAGWSWTAKANVVFDKLSATA